MATMMRWDPFQDLRSAQDEMAQMRPMLAHALGLHGQPQGSDRATAWAPALDISERKDAYLVAVELPGVKADELEITFEDGRKSTLSSTIAIHGNAAAEPARKAA